MSNYESYNSEHYLSDGEKINVIKMDNGIDMAQTIMRPLVQNILNAFHNTGNLTNGSQRCFDIVELSSDANCIIEDKYGFSYEKGLKEYKIHPLQIVYRNLFFHVESVKDKYTGLGLFIMDRYSEIYTIKLKKLYEHRLSLWEFGNYFGDLLVALSHEFDCAIVVECYPRKIYEILNETCIGIKGIRAITEISKTKYVTLGSNLEELSQYFFNVRTSCIRQVYDIYSIKRAKKAITEELLDIVGENYLQEITYIVDEMYFLDHISNCYELIPIIFSGHKKLSKGFIADMVFENSYNALKQATINNYVDDCKSNASCIIFGLC